MEFLWSRAITDSISVSVIRWPALCLTSSNTPKCLRRMEGYGLDMDPHWERGPRSFDVDETGPKSESESAGRYYRYYHLIEAFTYSFFPPQASAHCLTEYSESDPALYNAASLAYAEVKAHWFPDREAAQAMSWNLQGPLGAVLRRQSTE